MFKGCLYYTSGTLELFKLQESANLLLGNGLFSSRFLGRRLLGGRLLCSRLLGGLLGSGLLGGLLCLGLLDSGLLKSLLCLRLLLLNSLLAQLVGTSSLAGGLGHLEGAGSNSPLESQLQLNGSLGLLLLNSL